MKPLRVLVTACGCPGAATLIKMLQNNSERDLTVIGVDCDSEAIGRFVADGFYYVPPVALGDAYIEAIKDVVQRAAIDAILPENDLEIPVLAAHKVEIEALGCKVLVSSPGSVELARNKYKMYRALADSNVEVPDWFYPRDHNNFYNLSYELGYPEKPICFKPHISTGSRGFRIMDRRADRYSLLMNEKPNTRHTGLAETLDVLVSAQADWPDLLIMEYLDGMEYTVDCLCMDGRVLLVQVKSNEEARWGVTMRGELVDRPDLVEQTRRILEHIPLSYCVNLQFIDGKLIEINPRVSTFVFQPDLIPPYLAIKLALGEMTEGQVIAQQSKVQIGRRFVRYMDQVFF